MSRLRPAATAGALAVETALAMLLVTFSLVLSASTIDLVEEGKEIEVTEDLEDTGLLAIIALAGPLKEMEGVRSAVGAAVVVRGTVAFFVAAAVAFLALLGFQSSSSVKKKKAGI